MTRRATCSHPRLQVFTGPSATRQEPSLRSRGVAQGRVR